MITIALKLSSDLFQFFKHSICSGKHNETIRVLNAKKKKLLQMILELIFMIEYKQYLNLNNLPAT